MNRNFESENAKAIIQATNAAHGSSIALSRTACDITVGYGYDQSTVEEVRRKVDEAIDLADAIGQYLRKARFHLKREGARERRRDRKQAKAGDAGHG